MQRDIASLRNDAADQFAVRVERIALGRPFQAVIVPFVRGFDMIPAEMTAFPAVFAVSVPEHAADKFVFLVQQVVFHDVHFRSADPGIGIGAVSGGLEPGSGMPAVVFREPAADLVIPEGMQEFRFLIAAERPEAGGVFGDIVGERPGLQMGRGKRSVRILHQMQSQMAFAVELDPLIGEGREPFAPEIKPEIPFRPVQFRAVEFIVPGQLPVFAFRQQARSMLITPGISILFTGRTGRSWKKSAK